MMKKILGVFCVFSFISAIVNAAEAPVLNQHSSASDLTQQKMSSVHKQQSSVSSSVVQAASSTKAETEQSEATTDKAITALLKSNFKIGVTTTAEVKKRLGNPQTMIQNRDTTRWAYSMSSINKSLKGVGSKPKNEKTLEKIINLTFKNDKLVGYAIAGSK